MHARNACSLRVARAVEPVARAMCLVLVALGIAGCSLDNDALPPDVTDPALTQTPQGALAAYRGTLALFRRAFGGGTTDMFVATTGLLSDELLTTGGVSPEDARVMSEGDALPSNTTYSALQKVRGQARQAIGLLNRYVPEQPALTGHIYALQGYAEMFLAELFCSGIPLSTVDFDGDYTYRPGSTTEEVFTHAVALFDTALTLANDSTRFVHLAAIGKARALLALGEYAAAATVAASVTDDYQYAVAYSALVLSDSMEDARNFAQVDQFGWAFTVADREGGNGLDYVTSDDPRSLVEFQGQSNGGLAIYHPEKYANDGSSAIVLASGVEARLIEAEAALQAGDVLTWLNILNRLRTDSTSSGTNPDTLADTLGVTGCGPIICGDAPGGSDPSFGQPAGGFRIPAGYSLASTFDIDPVSPEIMQHCYDNSWYEPCYVDVDNPTPGRTTVYVYVKPGQQAWNAGTGGVSGLAPLEDPGTTAGRVDLLFRERAFWLFLTGHRQGDLRRLLRQYGRDARQAYPIGPYLGNQVYTLYGDDVTAPIPPSERVLNPHFTGCASRNA